VDIDRDIDEDRWQDNETDGDGEADIQTDARDIIMTRGQYGEAATLRLIDAIIATG